MKKLLVIVIGLIIIAGLAGPFVSGYILESRVIKLLGSIKESLPKNSVKYEKLKRGWFSSDIKVLIRDKTIAVNSTLHISHGPVLFKNGSVIFGLGYVDIDVADVQSKTASFGVIKEIFKRAQVDIVLNYQNAVTIDAKIYKLAKPVTIEKLKIVRLNNFWFNINIKLDTGVGKSILEFDDLEISNGNASVIIKQYNSSMAFLKSRNGANVGSTFGKIGSINLKYNANGKSKKISIDGLELRTATKAISGEISQDSLIEIKTITMPGNKLLNLKIPLRLNKLDERQFIHYDKLVSATPLNILELSKVITKIIAGEPEIRIDKAVLKLGDKEANMTILFKGVPLKKSDIINIFNFRKAIYFKSTINIPKGVLKELLSLAGQLVNDFNNLNKTENNQDIANTYDSTIKEWLERKIITESPTSYSIELEVKESKMYLNGRQQKSFLFP